MSVTRKLAFQPDILEWIGLQKTPLKALRKERYKMEKGFIAYGNDFVQFFRDRGNDKEKKDEAVSTTTSDDKSARAMDQYYEAEDLTKRMKWKRVTWDDDADYTSFSKRVLDNDSMFKRTPAFSFLSIHVIKDPSTTQLLNIPAGKKIIEPGTLTNWLLQEREPKAVDLYPVRETAERRSAFHADWTSGSVKFIDTASAQEILTFLSTVAPRLQAVQLKMEAQQTKQTADIEYVRVRVGTTLKFNTYNTSFWDDPKRKTDPDFVNPDELDQFLKGMLKSAFLYRWFLKGQEIRVVPPGRAYYVDVEKKEIQVPANFADYNWLRAHSRFEALETVVDSFRRFWWFWFSVGMIFVGDVELF
ncbi:putative mitochondrial hypothetical protein [Leptomonas pyrrhocoris]|uniref:Uncharacterized protein n=1 Tax=Leptomonas pyrrhocoris TaxID=157538 RepID=A0A0M9GAT5_LEPPY|nr:putative mitochondrial hypothetical protein [Leptomonas pyrrhocoris]XP_015664912.1 putative mitochondrial hypothetical protein [Leptomonas pyrrhocoris]KPA86472.1 putative mitochondrial hypothetical protein [Leptomonas pyrrhocoris]KPA86473.1 putative mitochondrial hypothetical protein [Leptomonas pyrrhocoris]|eukprot:XP_015664911.1 putative mitochondrial hypothetical protein [Leptomonas pyrrhocoris]